MRFWTLTALIGLSGCDYFSDLFGDKDDTGDTSIARSSGGASGTAITSATSTSSLFTVAVNWIDDGDSPADTDGDGLPDVGCGDRARIAITDPLGVTAWDFGMAETSTSNGWTGEDCLNGYAQFAFCHGIGLQHVLDEVTDCSVMSVVAGRTTLFDAEKDPYITYYLSDFSSCFVFGEDPTYYAVLGCTELMR